MSDNQPGPGPYGEPQPEQPQQPAAPQAPGYGRPPQPPEAPGPYGPPPQQGTAGPNPYAQPGPSPYGQSPFPYGQVPPPPAYGQPTQAGWPGPYAQPGQQDPYAQPGQQGPYGQPGQPGRPGVYAQPGQPGPYDQQNPYGGPEPYSGQEPHGGQEPYSGQFPAPGAYPYPQDPEAGAPRKKRTALVVTAVVAACAVIAGGVYFLTSGGSASDVADDGPHKLTAPATVLGGQFAKKPGSDTSADNDLDDAEKAGVKNPKDVSAAYVKGDKNNPLTQVALDYGGVYGQIDEPQKTLDAFFDSAKKEAAADKGGGETLVGSPRKVTPAGLRDAIMECQRISVKGDQSGTAGPKVITLPICVWADHSTLGFATTTDVASVLAGKATPIPQVAATAARLRADVRVKD